MRTILGSAITVAAVAHFDQSDKADKAYILHPLRMMMRLRTDDEELMAIAVLHDVLEDCKECTEQDLRDAGMTGRVVAGVKSLTHKDGESYEDYIKRCGQNPDARLVKIEDLRDNSDITRLKGLRPEDHKRMDKYMKAYTYLKELSTW